MTQSSYPPPLSQSIDRSRRRVLLFLLSGTIIVSFLLFLALVISYFGLGHYYVAGRMWVCAGSLLILGSSLGFLHFNRYKIAAFILFGYYSLLSAGIAWQWGINLPFGLLLFCMAIVVAGILLGARHTLVAAGFAIGSLALLQWGLDMGWYTTDATWATRQSHFGDVAGYSCIYILIAIIGWLFGREMETAMQRADEAEAGLLSEKALLEIRVEERTAQLRTMRLEKLRQLHRFAELGHLSTAVMHQVANHLSSLSLDIESLHDSQRQSAGLKRARRNLRHLNSVIKDTNQRLNRPAEPRQFDAVQQTKEVLNLLRQKAASENVTLDFAPPAAHPRCFGDTVQFTQVMSILIANAIEAYEDTGQKENRRIVEVSFDTTDSQSFTIRVRDYGKGIPTAQRRQLFQPFNTSKKQGTGVGLYIAQTMLRSHFKGNIQVNKDQPFTEFSVTLPRYAQYAKAAAS